LTTEASFARTQAGTRFSSILFDHTASRAERDDPSMFRDLNLDQVFTAVTSGRDEYDLMPFFRAPLRDVQSVEYRHQVQRDLEQQPLAKAVADFIIQMREMRGHLALSRKLRARYQRERWYLEAAQVYCRAVTTLADALGPLELGSGGFTGLRDYLASYRQSTAFTALAADIGTVANALAGVRYCVNIKGARVRVSRYEDEVDYGEQVRHTFAKFARDAAKDYRTGFRNLAEMDSVEERILGLVARLYPDEFGQLDAFCARHDGYSDETVRAFEREVQFYLAYREFTAPMTADGLQFCYPVVSVDSKRTQVRSAVDLALAAKLTSQVSEVVRNDFELGGPERIFVVTGPNHGGKSTFLRSVGVAQLMMQAGMFVAAQSYAASVSTGLFTHFKREEDATMEMGKLDEELGRMSRITDQLRPGCLLLCNESFASTNEREGSEIARQVVRALTESRIRVIFVTHLYDLAERWYASHDRAALFLRAEREPDGRRTFRVPPGEPLPTSYGQDLYQQVFGSVGA
jgi:DNA mismatch repair protein MutS